MTRFPHLDRRSFLTRRSFLKASGVALALPWLESISPAFAAPTGTRRMLNVCCSLGLYTPSWLPGATGAGYEATEYLALLDAYRDRFSVLSGLSHEEQVGRQPHNSEVTWLTGARRPGRDGFKNTISIDQAAANHLGYTTRFPSLVLASNSPQSQSYTANGVMVPAETSPAALFAKLFLQGTPEEIDRELRRIESGASILDHLRDRAQALRRDAPAADRQKLDSYFESVRGAERDLGEVGAWVNRPKPSVDEEPPVDAPNASYLIERIRLWFQLIALAFETDSTRVVSVMIQDHFVVPNLPGVNADLHSLSHHGQEPPKIAQLRSVETEIVRALGDLLADLDTRSDADGNLLDQTAILFGSNLGNANAHTTIDLPILVAGGGFSHGQHIAHEGPGNTPLSNLHVTLLQSMGLSIDTFGQSTGALGWS